MIGTAPEAPNARVARRVASLSAAAYAGMFVFGIVIALLGAVMPALSVRWAVSLADVGEQFLLMNFAILTTSLALGLAIDRVGLKLPLVAGTALVALALVRLALASDIGALSIAVIGLGIGGGALNWGTNTLVSDLHADPRRKSSALNLLGVFYGVGALCLPFTIGALVTRLGLAGLLIGTAILCGAVAIAAAVLRFPAPRQQPLPIAEMPRFLREPLVLLLACVLFFESGNEFVLGGYLATFLTREMEGSLDIASYALAGYWASIMIGRLVLSRLLLRVSGQTAILGSALLAAGAAFLIGAAPDASTTPAIAIVGMLLAGLSLAGIFPTVLGLAGSRFPDHAGTVFGLLFTVALAGGMLMPWIAGHLAQALGLRAIFPLVTANFLMVAALSLLIRRFRLVS